MTRRRLIVAGLVVWFAWAMVVLREWHGWVRFVPAYAWMVPVGIVSLWWDDLETRSKR